jgi:hypothetical protein
MKLEFSQQILKNTQISYFLKICPVGAELFHGDRRTNGQTDISKLIVTFAILRMRLKTRKEEGYVEREKRRKVNKRCINTSSFSFLAQRDWLQNTFSV